MKSLYESILSSTGSGAKHKFANDLDYQRKEILRLLKKSFNIRENKANSRNKNQFIGEFELDEIDAKEIRKKINLLETALKAYGYFESTSLQEQNDKISLKLTPPPTKQNLFPEVYISFVVSVLTKYFIHIEITDNRDWFFDWVSLCKKL